MNVIIILYTLSINLKLLTGNTYKLNVLSKILRMNLIPKSEISLSERSKTQPFSFQTDWIFT